MARLPLTTAHKQKMAEGRRRMLAAKKAAALKPGEGPPPVAASPEAAASAPAPEPEVVVEHPATANGHDHDPVMPFHELIDNVMKSGIAKDLSRAQVTVLVLKGQEIGMGPITAIQSLYLHADTGNIGMTAGAMQAKVLGSGKGMILPTMDGRWGAVAVRGEFRKEFLFTQEDAERAGMANDPIWLKYPEATAFARCVGMAARSVFPDVLMGASYSPEELATFGTPSTPRVRVHKKGPATGPSESPPKAEGAPAAAVAEKPESDVRPDGTRLVQYEGKEIITNGIDAEQLTTLMTAWKNCAPTQRAWLKARLKAFGLEGKTLRNLNSEQAKALIDEWPEEITADPLATARAGFEVALKEFGFGHAIDAAKLLAARALQKPWEDMTVEEVEAAQRDLVRHVKDPLAFGLLLARVDQEQAV